MKIETYNTEPETIEFDDNNINHVLSGPDYGQPWGCWDGWEEIEDWFNEECGFEESVIPVSV
jgi:hypothetical protein